ncbi:MAG TPA: sulfotransferase family protein [Stellaceae bacterium]|nr:sulfotransferase family protein [Stellaceae bacterium]
MPAVSDELQRMAERVYDFDPSLATLWLEPDGKYQRQGMTLDQLTRRVVDCLARGFRPLAAADFPTLYCAWGKARVGSTALINMFGLAGMPAYFQPVKAVLRYALTGGDATPWILPPGTREPQIFSKDVAGPYLLAECLYIPLQMLVEAGYPTTKLHLIVLDRDPVHSLASWLDKWSDRLAPDRLVRNHVLAALNARRVEEYARRAGVPVTHYVYEASKDAVRAARALFARLGIAERFTARCVTDWAEMGQLDSKRSGIIHPPEPDVYFVPGLHASDTAYRYRERGVAQVTDAQREILRRCGVEDVYRATAEACARELGLSIELAPAALRPAINARATASARTA